MAMIKGSRRQYEGTSIEVFTEFKQPPYSYACASEEEMLDHPIILDPPPCPRVYYSARSHICYSYFLFAAAPAVV
jgi:hypothetical protein